VVLEKRQRRAVRTPRKAGKRVEELLVAGLGDGLGLGEGLGLGLGG